MGSRRAPFSRARMRLKHSICARTSTTPTAAFFMTSTVPESPPHEIAQAQAGVPERQHAAHAFDVGLGGEPVQLGAIDGADFVKRYAQGDRELGECSHVFVIPSLHGTLPVDKS